MTRTSGLGKPEIIVEANWVMVCGVQVLRPPSIAPSQWLCFWQRAIGDENGGNGK